MPSEKNPRPSMADPGTVREQSITTPGDSKLRDEGQNAGDAIPFNEPSQPASQMSDHLSAERVLGPSGAEPLHIQATHLEPSSSQLDNNHSFREYPFPPNFTMTDDQREEDENNKDDQAENGHVEPPKRKQRILYHLCKHGGMRFDLLEMCKKYAIPLMGTNDHGESYQKTEDDLKDDIEFHLELEKHSAWYAVNQASAPISSPEARTILNAIGISTTTKSIVLSNSDVMPIYSGCGPSLCGMFTGKFPGKDAVFAMTKRWQVPVKVAFHSKGWIIFSFRDARDMETV